MTQRGTPFLLGVRLGELRPFLRFLALELRHRRIVPFLHHGDRWKRLLRSRVHDTEGRRNYHFIREKWRGDFPSPIIALIGAAERVRRCPWKANEPSEALSIGPLTVRAIMHRPLMLHLPREGSERVEAIEHQPFRFVTFSPSLDGKRRGTRRAECRRLSRGGKEGERRRDASATVCRETRQPLSRRRFLQFERVREPSLNQHE
jgi:hypothetical protein